MFGEYKGACNMFDDFISCTVKSLPSDLMVVSAGKAIDINPTNAPQVQFASVDGIDYLDPAHIAVLTTKYWGTKGVDLTVGFMEPTSVELREKFLYHMNLLGQTEAGKRYSNVKFRWTNISPQVRITREDSGYWSYLGIDILSIQSNKPTMCLQGFTMSTPLSEWNRALVHETGHTLGCPHEHLRPALIERLDVQKTIRYFSMTQGWSESTTRSNVLTPLDERSITGTTTAEQDSIMCYQLPGTITKDGLPIVGGTKLTVKDREFIGKIYPIVDVGEPPPVSSGKTNVVIETVGKITDAKIVSAKAAIPFTIIEPERFTWEDVNGILSILLELLKSKPAPPPVSASSRITVEVSENPVSAKILKVE